jgi:hypothetical protein
MAVFEGDIILARTPEEIEKLSAKPIIRRIEQAVVITGDDYRWPRGEIPYKIQPTLPRQDRITDAIKHFEDTTPIRFFMLTDSNAQYFPNYLTFRQSVNEQGKPVSGVCVSPVGMQGGQQFIGLSDDCLPASVTIHEIGHTVGLWHEQSREDRDQFVGIIWDNIVSGPTQDDNMRHNFDQHITDGDDVGPYDYCSIMHYGAWAFSIDEHTDAKPTIEILQPDLPCGDVNRIGHSNELSSGDKAAVIQMYANVIPGVGQNADGRLEVFLVGSDRQLYHRWQTAPNSSNWSDGWTSLGGDWWVGSNAAVAQNADGRLEVFLVGSDRQLYPRMQTEKNDSTKWSFPPPFIGKWPGEPSIRRDANGNLEVFMVDSNLQLSRTWQTGAGGYGWSNWQGLGGRFSPKTRPAIANDANGKLHLMMMMEDGRPYSYIEGADWTSLGGESRLGSDPSIAQNLDGRLELFLVGSDRRLYHRQQTAPNSGTWSETWTSLGGQWSLRRRPAVARNLDGRLEIFIVGLDKQLHHRSQTAPNSSQWSDIWTILGGQQWPPSSDPGIGRNADGRLEVFLVGSDKQLYHRRQTAPNSSTWSETWTPLGGQFP